MLPPDWFPAAWRLRPLLAAATLSLLYANLAVQAAPPAAPAAKGTDLLAGLGGFENPLSPAENLWDGVTSDGLLAGFTFSPDVVTERGSFGKLAMPPSVAFVDLNGDGKPDLITADPTGYFRFYPNSGTATEPKFTSAEIIPIFLSTAPKQREWEWTFNYDTDLIRMCPRFALADWRRSGLLDFVVGNYYGNVFFIPNTGSAQRPEYRTPVAGIKAAELPTNDQGRYWGNLLSPAACDWGGKSGRPDLLLGEGTYSANSIHEFENLGDSVPKFSSAKTAMVAYGDGREQLIPTVADFNGDGNPDLVIADRTGEVGLYLNPGKPDPKVELKRTSTITFGATSKLGGVVSPYAADFNGDGLIDLIIGLPNGHIGVSLNSGTKTEPKFGPVVELKGTPRFGRNVKLPAGWRTDTWPQYGNALAYFTVVNAQDDPTCAPPEGASCLKAGYWPAPAQTFPMPDTGMPGGTRHFTFYRENLVVNCNKNYKVTFKVKNSGMEKLHYELETHYRGVPGIDKVEKDERGGAKHAGRIVEEYGDFGATFSAGSGWTAVEGRVTPRYKDPDLRAETTMPVRFYVDFYAATQSSVIYFDDFHLVEE